MPPYTLRCRLSHADVDFLGELKVSAFLGLLQQAAVEASAAVGFDPVWYTRAGRVWVIRRTTLERCVPIGGGEALEIETAIMDFRRARSLRGYTARRDGTLAAQATTDWVYCDVASNRPARISDDMQRAFGDGAAAVTLPRPAALPAAGSGDPVIVTVTVQPSHLDHVVHVNNAVYASYLEDAAFARFAQDNWPLRRMLDVGGALRIRTFDIEYLSDVQEGERLTIATWPAAENDSCATSGSHPIAVQLVQTISAADGRAVLRARSEWGWRTRSPILGGVPSADA